MTESTNGICLHYYKYSESSVIAKIFTERYGMKSYIMKGVRKKKSKKKLNLLHSLNIVELEVSNNDKRQIQYMKSFTNMKNINRCPSRVKEQRYYDDTAAGQGSRKKTKRIKMVRRLFNLVISVALIEKSDVETDGRTSYKM